MNRTGVHILFFDHDSASGLKTLSLLRSCSYQVSSVKRPVELIEVLDSGKVDVDLILTEMEPPPGRSCRILKQILLQESLSHIPVVVMSECDEMAVVAKCLQLGAADYLVKPLRLNEVRNLWTHMWRRRRMLGLPEKHETAMCSSLPIDSSITDTSESNNVNTMSLLGELSKGCEKVDVDSSHMTDAYPHFELSLRLASNFTAGKLEEQVVGIEGSPDVPLQLHATGIELKIGKPSAFATYIKHLNKQSSEQSPIIGGSNTNMVDSFSKESYNCRDNMRTVVKMGSVNRLMTPPAMCSEPAQFSVNNQPGNRDMATRWPRMSQDVFSYYSMTPHAVASQFVGLASWPRAMVVAVPASATLPTPTLSPTSVHVTACSEESTMAQRREAALNKFRLKRKDRCFEKKIRYASRKKLAEQRPRVRGQFVKREHVVESVVLKGVGSVGSVDEEEQAADDGQNFSPDESIVGSSMLI